MPKIKSIFYIRARQAKKTDIMGSMIYPLHKRLVALCKATYLPRGANIDDITQNIYEALSHMKVLVFFDRSEILEVSDEAQEFPIFFSSLFCETKYVRVFLTARKNLGIHSIGGVGGYLFRVKALNLKNTVRLFGMVYPYIHNSNERRHLIEKFVYTNDSHLYATEKSISVQSKVILNILDEYIPSRTFDAY